MATYVEACESAWQRDGIRALEWSVMGDQIQVLFSTRPEVRPDVLAARAKGRLQHVLRGEEVTDSFKRNFCLQTVGGAKSADVDRYLREQLQHGDFADPRYREGLASLAYSDPGLVWDEEQQTGSGRYVLAFHLVFVTTGRWRMPWETAVKVQRALMNAAVDSVWRLAKLSMMPDHVHLAVKGGVSKSPVEIGEEIREVTSKAVGTAGFWMPTWYMGSFGKYGMGAVRAHPRDRGGRSRG